ncbi:MAG: LacI family DNA-binding transcriptional regulator [Christensenellales bacterium]|jgi:DNA-binding LacI/PurR family transcriptional regulator
MANNGKTVKANGVKMPTIKDVAFMAGVTPAIVSRVFNNDAKLNIKEETRAKVLDAIEKLQYRPNPMARSLRTNSNKTIGVLISDINNPFYSEIIKGVQMAAREHDYCIILGDTSDTPHEERRFIENLQSQFVDGIILSSVYIEDDVVELLEERGTHYVMVNRGSTNSTAPHVRTNEDEGMIAAVNHVIELGHTKIACIHGPLYADTAVRRLQGFRKALKDADIEYNPEYVAEGRFDENSGYLAGKKLLTLDDPPSAICSCNDLMAIGVMRAAQELGLCIPEDFSLVGFNNIWITDILAVPLTTVETPLIDMGKEAFRALMALIKGEEITKTTITLPIKLIVRESTSPPKEGK